MALARMMDVDLKGGCDDHLKTEPVVKKTENFYTPAKEMTKSAASKIAGFYVASHNSDDQGLSDQEDNEEPEEEDEITEELNDDNEGEWTQVGGNKKKLHFEEESSDDEEFEVLHKGLQTNGYRLVEAFFHGSTNLSNDHNCFKLSLQDI